MALLAQLLDDVIVHKFDIVNTETLIGRKTENDIAIDDSAVSSVHAKITLQPNEYFAEYLEAYIEDLGSTNGTSLNGQPVIGRQRLRHNDIIKVAWNQFKYIDESEEEMEKTVHLIASRSGSSQ